MWNIHRLLPEQTTERHSTDEPPTPLLNCSPSIYIPHAQTQPTCGTIRVGPVSRDAGKALRRWEESPSPTLPKEEVTLLLPALQSMSDNTVVQHPCVAVSSTRSPPQITCSGMKTQEKASKCSRTGGVMWDNHPHTNFKDGTSYTPTAPPKSTSYADGCVPAVSQYCRVHRTACPTNTPELFVGHGGGIPPPPLYKPSKSPKLIRSLHLL